MNRLKIVHIASEISPYVKTGGLADVVRSLPRALKRLGHQVIVIAPYYGTIKQGKFKLEKLNYQEEIILNGHSYPVRFYKTISSDKYPIFFIEQKKLFTSRHKIYGYPDDGLRFLLFNLATLKLLTLIKFKPQIIHCHDWQAGLIPNYLQLSRRYQKLFKNTATLFTIHNLLWQGPFDWWTVPPEHKDTGQGLPSIKPEKIRWLNFTKRAILYADIINTVSERYAQEILTKKYGEGLDKYLCRRQTNVHGIINGIDYKVFNPLFDKNLYYCYDYDALDKKNKNKTALQRKLSLKIGRDIPMIGIINRLTEQKGFELIMQITDYLLRDNLQIVVVGSGNKKYRDFFHKLAKKYPQQVAISTPFSEKMARRVYAASDLYLMPSRFEPCGLSQMISLRYGSVPIVHQTGGLSDTITDFNPRTGRGNGFVFKTYDPIALLLSINRALETYKYVRIWEHLVWRAMRQSFSWQLPAKKYVVLYRKAIRQHKRQSNQKKD